jgi:hypothetical protein
LRRKDKEHVLFVTRKVTTLVDVIKINDFIEKIQRLNVALDAVGWGAKIFPATFSPKVGIIMGPNAKTVLNSLATTNKIQEHYELSVGRKAKVYAILLSD